MLMNPVVSSLNYSSTLERLSIKSDMQRQKIHPAKQRRQQQTFGTTFWKKLLKQELLFMSLFASACRRPSRSLQTQHATPLSKGRDWTRQWKPNYPIWFSVGVSIPNSQKLIEWVYREVEGYSRPEKHCEPIQHNSDLYSFHTTVGYKFYSSSHRLKTRRHWNTSGDIKQENVLFAKHYTWSLPLSKATVTASPTQVKDHCPPSFIPKIPHDMRLKSSFFWFQTTAGMLGSCMFVWIFIIGSILYIGLCSRALY